jgi:hypothetical protein
LYGITKSYNKTNHVPPCNGRTEERRNPCLLSHIFMNFSTNRNDKNTFIGYDGKIDLLSVLVAKTIMSKTGVNIIVKKD